RVDGVLRQYMQVPKWLQNAVVSRLKILAQLDIAERRRPQDGRIKVQFRGRPVDLRVSTLPTHFGEKVVMRLLGSSHIPTFQQMGFSDPQNAMAEQVLSQPQGMILVTGPTGAGKSTTLYSMLTKRQSVAVNIVTIEDPIEYQLPGINQVQINTKAGLTFASVLRSILRQDPDVILVGEIRDLETAEIAFQAAMTGHLVLSTLHTNSAIATINRLLDLGVDPVLISSSITLIIAQRLVRKLCNDCKKAYDPPPGLLERLGGSATDGYTYYKAEGCNRCGGSGFNGRMALHEMLPMNNIVREMIVRKAGEYEIQQAMKEQGMQFLLERGMARVREGVTAISEL